MTLEGFQVIQDDHGLDGVAVHCWEGQRLVLALITRQAIDDTFDQLRPHEEDRRRITKQQGNLLVDANISAFARIICAKTGTGDYTMVARGGYERPVVMITFDDVQRSGEKFSAGVLAIADRFTWVDVDTGLPT
jgi:hypothetical protein